MRPASAEPPAASPCPICGQPILGSETICAECGFRLEPATRSASPVLLTRQSRGIQQIRLGLIAIAVSVLGSFAVVICVVAPPSDLLLLAAIAAFTVIGLLKIAGGVLTAFGARLLRMSCVDTCKPLLRRQLGLLAFLALAGVAASPLGLFAEISEGLRGPALRRAFLFLHLLTSSALVPVAFGVARSLAEQLGVPAMVARAAWYERISLLASSTSTALGLAILLVALVPAPTTLAPASVLEWLIGVSFLVLLVAVSTLLLLVIPLSGTLGTLSRVVASHRRRLPTPELSDRSA